MTKNRARAIALQAAADAIGEANWLLFRDWDLDPDDLEAAKRQLRTVQEWLYRRSDGYERRAARGGKDDDSSHQV